MKTFSLAVAFLVAMATAAWGDVSKEDLKKLAQAGLGEDTILAYVKSHGPVSPLSPDDLAELKKAGLSEKVLTSLVTLQAAGVPTEPPPATGTEKSSAAPAPSTTPYVLDRPSDYPYTYVYPYGYPYYAYSYPYFYPSFNLRIFPRTRFFPPFRPRGFVIRR